MSIKKNWWYFCTLSLLAGSLSAIGCKSSTSTFLARHDNDQLNGVSNGQPDLHCAARPFRGIPVTMPVLSHVDIAIMERIYLEPDTLSPIRTRQRNLCAVATPVHTDKIFSVDPKRPASGTSDFDIMMTADAEQINHRQYFKSISSNIDDTTIATINTALGGLLPLLSPRSLAKDAMTRSLEGDDSPLPFVEVERTVAWKRFDINAPDFTDQVRVFVEEHLNNCHSCQGAGDCVTQIH